MDSRINGALHHLAILNYFSHHENRAYSDSITHLFAYLPYICNHIQLFNFMQILKTHYHPSIETLDCKSIFTRLATRAIAIQDENILLLYTERYEDYSLPGGGLDEAEDRITGMKRELIEETGAKNILNIKPFGAYVEYRPWYKPDFDIQHMISYCYTCEVDKELGASSLESYEIKNGMEARWVNIYEAIKHNEQTMATSKSKGMSIDRETYLLRRVVERILIQ